MNRTATDKRIVDYLSKYNPDKIGIFGSFARGEETDTSDLDILVSFRNAYGLLKLVKMERELSELIGRKVDLMTERSLKNEKLKTYVLRDLQVIYEEG